MLLRGWSYPKTAKALRVSRNTLHRWRRRPDFQQSLLDGQRGLHAAALTRLAAMSDAAADRLAALVRSKDPRVALAAATAILKTAEGHAVGDLEQKLRTLEARLGLDQNDH